MGAVLILLKQLQLKTEMITCRKITKTDEVSILQEYKLKMQTNLTTFVVASSQNRERHPSSPRELGGSRLGNPAFLGGGCG